MMEKDEKGKMLWFVAETACPSCRLIIHLNTLYKSITIYITSSRALLIYPKNLLGRLRRAWDSLLGRYSDEETILLDKETAEHLANILQKCSDMLR